ncbi:hypothetical protein ACE0DR_11615 [Azotobacter sp. CWF10]
MQVRQTDAAGNVGAVGSHAAAITVDITAPAAPTLALASDTGASAADGLTSAGTVLVSGLEAGASWEYSTDGGQSWTAGSGERFVLAEGGYAAGVVQARQTDAAGNTGAAGSNLAAITVDTTAPAEPVLTLASDTGTSAADGLTSAGTILVSGLEAGASWEYSSDGGQSWSAGSGERFVLAEGRYAAGTLQVRQTDAAGNTGAAGSNGAAITVDTTAPAAPSLALASDTGPAPPTG